MSRSRAYWYLIAGVMLAMLLGLSAPSHAAATRWLGYSTVPRSVSASTFSVRFQQILNYEMGETGGTYLLRGHKTATTFYIWDRCDRAKRRVSYAAFVRYMRGLAANHEDALYWADWGWKTTGSGSRYRYLKALTLDRCSG